MFSLQLQSVCPTYSIFPDSRFGSRGHWRSVLRRHQRLCPGRGSSGAGAFRRSARTIFPLCTSSDPSRSRSTGGQLQRWHIPESALPPGSMVLHKEPTLWERYRRYVIAAVSVIAAQAILILGLLWQRGRKRKAEAVLRESEERFRLLANTTPAMIWMCDAEGKTTYVNDRRTRLYRSGCRRGAWRHVDGLRSSR